MIRAEWVQMLADLDAVEAVLAQMMVAPHREALKRLARVKEQVMRELEVAKV